MTFIWTPKKKSQLMRPNTEIEENIISAKVKKNSCESGAQTSHDEQ